MKIWMNILFYSICFFALGAVIYRLAFIVPPFEEDAQYARFCLSVGILAAIVSGTAVGFAACFDWYQSKHSRKQDKTE